MSCCIGLRVFGPLRLCVICSELALGVFVIVMLNGVFAIVHSLLFVLLCRRMHRRGAQAAGSALASEWCQLRAATNCMVHHRAHMPNIRMLRLSKAHKRRIVPRPWRQPLLPVARGMTMPLQLNEAEFAQQGNEAEFAQQGPGKAALGNAFGLSILQLGHGEVSSSGWRVDGIIARSALGQSILLPSFVSF